MKNFGKIIFLTLCSVSAVLGFELVLNTGRNANTPFAILHLNNEQNFTCIEQEREPRNFFVCEIAGVVDNELKKQKFDFFDLDFQKNEQNTRIFIYPKTPVKRYNLSQKIFNEHDIKGNLNDTNSTSFSFIFSAEIPFIKEYNGLNFDIVFPNVNNPVVGALDLDSNPVVVPQSGDINTFLRIKTEYEQENYPQVITDATHAITRYEGSIFMNEFMLYRLRAQNQLYTNSPDFRNQNELEAMIDEAKVWNRQFASDKNYPEVLYITLRAYIAMEQRSNADYTLQILRTEHDGHYFTELALLDYADYLLRLGNKAGAKRIFDDLYYKSKNVNIATRAGLSIARLALNEKDNAKAIELINTVMKSNKNYFSQDKDVALELAKLLYDGENFALSAEIYELAFVGKKESDADYEQVLRALALAMSKTQNYEKAKQYLDLYRQDYANSEHIALIKEAYDNVFFNIPDNNSSFLHARYKELMSEYANEIAAKALIADVKLYYDENNTAAVMDYKEQIEKYDNAELKNLLESSAVSALNAYLRADDCIKATALNEAYSTYDLGQKIYSKKALLGCFKRTLRTTQAKAYIDKNRNEDEIFYDLERAELDLNDKEYKAALALSNAVLNSRTLKSEEEKHKANYLKFLAQLRSGDYNSAVATLKVLDSFPMDYKMVELYNEFLSYCTENNLTTTILTYAPKAIDFQNLKGVNVYTPELEFMYLSALNKSNQDGIALEVLRDLLKVNLKAEDKARALYTQSQIFERRGDRNAQRQSLNQCVQMAEISSWQSLCRDRLDLLRN